MKNLIVSAFALTTIFSAVAPAIAGITPSEMKAIKEGLGFTINNCAQNPKLIGKKCELFDVVVDKKTIAKYKTNLGYTKNVTISKDIHGEKIIRVVEFDSQFIWGFYDTNKKQLFRIKISDVQRFYGC